jgi:heme-degrading monooxygenase HmoA
MDKLLVLYRISVDTRQQEFEKAYRKYKPHIESVPGHISEILARSMDDPACYMIVSIWQPEDFFAWLQSPSHAEMVDMLNRYKRAYSHVSRYTVMESLHQSAQQIASPRLISS